MIKAVIRSAFVIALAGAILCLAQTARAEEKKAEKPKPHESTGVIESVDAKAGTVTIKHKKESVTFTAAADIKFGHKGEKVAMTIADLKVGDRVTVHYTEEGDKKIAHKVSHVENKPKDGKTDKK